MWQKKKKKERNCILESPDKNIHLIMLIKKSGTKLIKILSKECYKYIKSMKRQKLKGNTSKWYKGGYGVLKRKISDVFFIFYNISEFSKLSVRKLCHFYNQRIYFQSHGLMIKIIYSSLISAEK